MTKLPSVLEHEPLVDAVFEMRLGGEHHMADLLPGVIFGQLDPKPQFRKLPTAEVPSQIRSQEPSLAFAALVRFDHTDVTISFGDQNLVIGCKLPYPKWPAFKKQIMKIIKILEKAEIDVQVTRYSLKYVNLIQAESLKSQIAKIDMSIRVGDVEVDDDVINVRIVRQEEDTMHIITIATGVQVPPHTGQQGFGVIVDVDSIREIEPASFGVFARNLESAVDTLRQENKKKFFRCLTDAALNEMEPRYD